MIKVDCPDIGGKRLEEELSNMCSTCVVVKGLAIFGSIYCVVWEVKGGKHQELIGPSLVKQISVTAVIDKWILFLDYVKS